MSFPGRALDSPIFQVQIASFRIFNYSLLDLSARFPSAHRALSETGWSGYDGASTRAPIKRLFTEYAFRTKWISCPSPLREQVLE
jgi:hypothetical protein